MTLQWRVLSTDLRTGEVGPDVPLDNGSWTQVAGRPDEFRGSLPLWRCPPVLLEGGRMVLHLVVGGLFVASAIAWDVRATRDVGPATVRVVGKGLESYWDSRRLRVTQTFDEVDEADIVAALVDLTESGGSGIGIDTSQVTPTGKVRTRIDKDGWSADERPPIGRLIRYVQELEDGPLVDVVVSRPDPAAAPVRTLRVRPSGAVGTIPGTLKLGEAIAGYDLQILGSQQANDQEVIGAGEGAKMVVGRAVDSTSLTSWPQLDGAEARKSIKRRRTADEHARANLARSSRPPVPLTLQLDPDRRPRPSAWTVGDILDVNLYDPPLHVKMPMQAVGRTWNLSGDSLTVSAVCNPIVAERPGLTVPTTSQPPTLRTAFVTADGNDGSGSTWDGNDGPGRVLDGNSTGIVTAAS